MFFIVYIADFCRYLVPADDTRFTSYGDNFNHLNSAMEDIEKRADEWFNNNFLKLNTDKTKRRLFSIAKHDNNER